MQRFRSAEYLLLFPSTLDACLIHSRQAREVAKGMTMRDVLRWEIAAVAVAAQGARREEHHAPSQRVACSLRCSQRRVTDNWGNGDCDVKYTLNAEARTTKFSFEALFLAPNVRVQCRNFTLKVLHCLFLLACHLGAVIHPAQIYGMPVDRQAKIAVDCTGAAG